MPYGIFDVRVIVTPEPLDKTYKLQCDCGWYVDLGYMWATAEHLYKLHKKRYPDHQLDMVVNETTPLQIDSIKKKMNAGKTRKAVTIRVEPGLT